ncbi:MAG TPA: toll/interleukin-1 receptor domain-containing protein [Allosphingosinicella sp.]
MDERSGRYVAFLSYSHKDAAIARWLHRRLETYRMPRRLVGRPAEPGPVPARLTPIFRDREELPAARDLSERVRTALAASDNLIVVCSPNSAASPWVAKEIAAFRELHPGRSVLAAIVDGEPAQCFPANLPDGEAEPLAADLRPERDGRRLGFLKLVAGLTGVGLDALVQREAQRRVRRVTAVTGAAVAAMLIMAVMTILALNARREAQRQRAEAESLVEFMLTDLRERLKGVGRLDVLTAVNQRALDHYRRQELSDLPAEALERRARVLHAMGEDDVTRGELDRALLQFREASRTTQALLADAPDDSKRIFAHAQSEYWVGRVHELRREWPEAARRYANYAAGARRLIAIDPHNPEYMMEMGWGAQNVGVVQLRGSRQLPDAQRSFEIAVRWFSAAAKARPGDVAVLRELANAYSYLAESRYLRDDWVHAIDAYRRQYGVMQVIASIQPRSADIEYRLAIAERAVGLLSQKVGDHAAARHLLGRAYATSSRLAAHDAHNVEWQLLKTMIECDLLKPKGMVDLGLSRRRLTEAARHGIGRLVAQHHPSAAELKPCLGWI